ncbi:MAG: hypothetical protein IT455_22045 [Planctomycetes bacterium]|nr:hypothetical protein [Planctomycetota bacterium]
MLWLYALLFRGLPVLLVVVTARGLGLVLPTGLALLATTAVGATMAALGASLLRVLVTGRMGWRNRVAGLLLPWGYRLGRGRLAGIVVGTTAGWLLLGAATLFGWPAITTPAPEPPGATPAPSAPWWLWLAWTLQAMALLTVLLALIPGRAHGVRVVRSRQKVAGLLVLMIGGSVLLHTNGHTWLAGLVAAGPPLALALFAAGFLAIVLLSGHRMRWN